MSKLPTIIVSLWILLAVCLPEHRSYASEAPAPEGSQAEAPVTEGEGAKKEGKKEEGGDEKSKKDGPKDVSGGRFAGDPVYVHLAPMILPVISNDGVEQLVTFRIDLEVTDFDTADHIHTIMPRVVDALMQALYGGLGQGSLRHGKLVDVGKIKAKAIAALNDVIGANNIRDVLIQGVAQRML